MTGRRVMAGLGLVPAAAVAVWLASRAVAPASGARPVRGSADGSIRAAFGDDERAAAARGSTRSGETPRPGAEGAESGPAGLSRRAWLERAIREARIERLRQADPGRGTEPGEGAAVVSPEDERGHLGPEYIRSRVRELVPLIAECYELALHEQADLEGRLVVEFTIAGEPDVGGIVEESRIAEASTLRHPTLDECVRETMYTAELEAPEGGGRVTVRYPFTFRPESAE